MKEGIGGNLVHVSAVVGVKGVGNGDPSTLVETERKTKVPGSTIISLGAPGYSSGVDSGRKS